MATRDELVVALAGRYAASNRKERERILVEFAAVSGSPRKHAMRLLRAGCLARPCVAGYDPYLCRGRLRNEGQGFSQRRHHRPKRPSQRRHPAIIVGIFESLVEQRQPLSMLGSELGKSAEFLALSDKRNIILAATYQEYPNPSVVAARYSPPQQRQRHVRPPEIPVNRRPVRHRAFVGRHIRRRREQQRPEVGIVHPHPAGASSDDAARPTK
jgi:hypothetical protein